MAQLLLEILCEEIPARMQLRAGADLAKAMTDGLKKSGLTVENAQSLTGPRRLSFIADIPAASPDVSEERKGPRLGAPEQALAGFLRGAGLSDIAQAQTRSDKKGEFYVAVIEKKGQPSADIIQELVPAIMGNFPWPKSMKSGASSFRWVRPLSSIICLLDGEIVDFTVGGIRSGNITHGHRRMGAGPFTVTGFADYSRQLEEDGKVILRAEDRKETILTDARKACAAKGLELVEDEGLLNEVAGLAEYPIVILGDMDPEFLKLPSEVIRLSMRTHQKYFAVRDPKSGELAPNFIVVANQAAPDGGKAIAEGNSRVLSARLSDALFFEQQDAKLNLEDYYDKLGTVVFHQKLGSIKDKAERVAALAKELAPKVGAEPDVAEKAAKLAKCDLVTNMVIEFTSLQGQIGSLMYKREGGDGDIATAIEQHYKPQGPSDNVPTDPVAVAVALADKLDTLVGFWAIDEKPTGSKDPYALRRAALGVVRIVLENKVRFSFIDQIKTQIENAATCELSRPPENRIITELNSLNPANLLTFILDRLKVVLRDQGLRHDLIDAVFALGGDDLVDITARATALQDFLSSDDGANLLAGYKRAANILRAEAKKGDLPNGKIDAPLLAKGAPSEQALAAALGKVEPKIQSALSTEDYESAMSALSDLRAPIDGFFDDVMVNDDDDDIRANRLGLLMQIRKLASLIADFDKIDG